MEAVRRADLQGDVENLVSGTPSLRCLVNAQVSIQTSRELWDLEFRRIQVGAANVNYSRTRIALSYDMVGGNH